MYHTFKCVLLILIIMAVLEMSVRRPKIDTALLSTVANREHAEFTILTRSERKIDNLIHYREKKKENT